MRTPRDGENSETFLCRVREFFHPTPSEIRIKQETRELVDFAVYFSLRYEFHFRGVFLSTVWLEGGYTCSLFDKKLIFLVRTTIQFLYAGYVVNNSGGFFHLRIFFISIKKLRIILYKRAKKVQIET